jgi:hypothetical protein
LNILFSISTTTLQTITRRFASRKPAENKRCRAAYSGINFNRGCRAISSAGSAFHAKILIGYPRSLFIHFKHAVRANFQAATATDTLIGSKRKRCDIF